MKTVCSKPNKAVQSRKTEKHQFKKKDIKRREQYELNSNKNKSYIHTVLKLYK